MTISKETADFLKDLPSKEDMYNLFLFLDQAENLAEMFALKCIVTEVHKKKIQLTIEIKEKK